MNATRLWAIVLILDSYEVGHLKQSGIVLSVTFLKIICTLNNTCGFNLNCMLLCTLKV